MTDELTSLGESIRAGRIAKSMSLRELARAVEKAPSYLNDIEYDRRTPSEDVLRSICTVLDLDLDRLLGLAGRLGADADRFLRRRPTAGVLFRVVSDADLDEDDLQKLRAQAEKLARRKREQLAE